MTTEKRLEELTEILGQYMNGFKVSYCLDEILALDDELAPSLFEQVMTASERYVTRFGGTPNRLGAFDKFDEEVEEFDHAAAQVIIDQMGHEDNQPIAGKTYQLRQAMLEEFIDVMVTGGGILSVYGFKWTDVEAAARAKLDNLDNRTEADYVWDEKSKTVIKRSKLEKTS